MPEDTTLRDTVATLEEFRERSNNIIFLISGIARDALVALEAGETETVRQILSSLATGAARAGLAPRDGGHVQ
jgi:hypothetical protein